MPKDPKLLLPKDFQPNKEFHPKIGHEDEDEDDEHGDGDEGDDDVDHPNSFPSMPGSLPRTNVGHGKIKITMLIPYRHLTFTLKNSSSTTVDRNNFYSFFLTKIYSFA